eukprot:6458085-Amphidinium_carterae.1
MGASLLNVHDVRVLGEPHVDTRRPAAKLEFPQKYEYHEEFLHGHEDFPVKNSPFWKDIAMIVFWGLPDVGKLLCVRFLWVLFVRLCLISTSPIVRKGNLSPSEKEDRSTRTTRQVHGERILCGCCNLSCCY